MRTCPFNSQKTILTTGFNDDNIDDMFSRLTKGGSNIINTDQDSLYYIFLEVLRLHYYRTHTLLDEIGIYHGQPLMLLILNDKDGQSQTELATRLNLKAPTITVMLKRMEKANLVVRKQDRDDQRVSRVYITERGREVFKKAMGVMDKFEEEFFKDFTGEEKIILKRLLKQMNKNLASVIDKEQR